MVLIKICNCTVQLHRCEGVQISQSGKARRREKLLKTAKYPRITTTIVSAGSPGPSAGLRLIDIASIAGSTLCIRTLSANRFQKLINWIFDELYCRRFFSLLLSQLAAALFPHAKIV
ncbi:hypothetical protein L6452_24569 [Arctium lappa]|uniref:Uncharacterized protein n=1 Tax=Arctium lappa TaxID=4217 RepID=A0ACB9A9K1_ARCLA|nr:hypothetical protein L6452_24569 [Arctium lappa]